MSTKIVEKMAKTLVNKLIVLGTGGTIAGTSDVAGDNIGYTAAQVGVGQLLQAVPGLTALLEAYGVALVCEQVAQVDSKDMDFCVWQALAARVSHHLAQSDVLGVVVTHGTDTLEETAFFLHTVLPPTASSKPVVLTCAMRPATATAPDGPQNVLDAFAVALDGNSAGVMAVCAGTVHSAVDIQKTHPYRVDAFGSGDAGPLGYVEEGAVRWVRFLGGKWPKVPVKYHYFAIKNIAIVSELPRVEIVMSHAGATGDVVDALLMQSAANSARPLLGIVVAATGNGTIHQLLEVALLRAQAAGVTVVRATRCPMGRVLPTAQSVFPDSDGLSPVKARIALMLALLAKH
jgi:L-asparaginase